MFLMHKLKVGLAGFGTVGAGVVKLLHSKRREIARKTGVLIDLVRIVDKDITSPRGVKIPGKLLSRNLSSILEDEDIEVVVELIGGIREARALHLEAFKRGKSVVTANKALLAAYGGELFARAQDAGVALSFEASCSSGVPVIAALRDGLIANRLTHIWGILNSTSNYILSRMAKEKVEYKEALKTAQEEGYAESRPHLDVQGVDAAHKLSILARLGFGVDFNWGEIFHEGITRVKPRDIDYAAKLGYVVKPLAIGKSTGNSIELRVHPTLVPLTHPLSTVDGINNAVWVRGDAVGEVLFYGQGAGQMPAASAVVSDLIDVALGRAKISLKELNIYPGKSKIVPLKPMGKIITRYYLRVTALDKPGVLAQVAGILGKHKISISSVIQQESGKAGAVPVVIMTHQAREENMQKALKEIDLLKVIKGKSALLRVEG